MDDDKKLSIRLQSLGGAETSVHGVRDDNVSAKVVQSVRRRIVALSTVTVTLWGLVAAGFIAFPYAFLRWVWPWLIAALTDPVREDHMSRVDWVLRNSEAWLHPFIYGTYVWASLVVAAAACTIALISISRQATLRQIQRALAELAEDVRRLSAER